ncbi:LysE family translocator [Pseudomonas sp. GOM6]|uniref:LysE family translocator n=1 Tax=Pseudomonas sp. GOM6 TaxID=3036944 RepID=UPI002409D96F|nr:LysE family translocator [Pseudomonas sp. GOM6]MDG1582760.1 LysE family translocator [Pseudomonas sp. GOM6]
MHVFLLIAAAHFLALLSPGPDFFLIARCSLAHGWRIATGACLGIALGNGLFILLAFLGTGALKADSPWFLALQLAGCGYLLYLGVLFIRHAGRSELTLTGTDGSTASWYRVTGMGLLSALLNPKNALFYASLAAMLSGPYASAGWKLVYGLWMFAVVLVWDLLIAVLIGNRRMLRRFNRALPWLERVSGTLLILLALGVLGRAGLNAG